MHRKDIDNIGDLAVKVITEHQNYVARNEHECDPEEVEMARSQLASLEQQSKELFNLIAHMPSLEGWVAAKITKASDYISSVHDWLKYESKHGSDEHRIVNTVKIEEL